MTFEDKKRILDDLRNRWQMTKTECNECIADELIEFGKEIEQDLELLKVIFKYYRVNVSKEPFTNIKNRYYYYTEFLALDRDYSFTNIREEDYNKIKDTVERIKKENGNYM